ncbi:MAG: BlaI/MecI/CopY family transcriptional regulator [Lachnospiraceae bacterium]|nr:BlaI/MecI/CopY family transcriptional regulator [Lachnospiraceae bacterium]
MKISDAEWKIMSLLWESEPMTITQLTKGLLSSTGWTKYTVMTYLKRMEEKGIVYHVAGEKAKLYYADIEKDEAMIHEKNNFLTKVFKGNAALMISTMVEYNELSEEEIDKLIEILEKKR